MITIWGKHAPHIQHFTHTGAGWELVFPCGHQRFITNEAAIDLHVKRALPICDALNCTGSAPPKPATLAHCPTTLSAPGMAIRRCTLPWGHTGDHHDPSYGPWASLAATSPETSAPITTLQRWTAFGQPRCPSVSPVTDRHQCRLALGHAPGHVSACGKFEWADNTKDRAYYQRLYEKAKVEDAATDRRRRQAEADLTSLANGDRLGPDATNNARIVQDRIESRIRERIALADADCEAVDKRYNLGVFYTDEKGNPDGGARVNAIVERQKFEASVSESIMRLTRSLAVRRENEALADEKLKALKRDLLALTAFVDQVWKGQQ